MIRARLSATSALAVLAIAGVFAQQPSTGGGARTAGAAVERARFLEMFARGYYPGRSGQLMIVPKQGEILTRDEPEVRFMHGSPWSYDSSIPMLFVGPQISPGVYTAVARQQDLAATVAKILGAPMPPTTSGRALPIVRAGAPRPRAVLVVALDGMRFDYFSAHERALPTLTSLRKRGAWFTNTRINYLPTNTAAGHSSVSTGAEPRAHGITGNNLFDRVAKKRHDTYAAFSPQDLMALSLADVWQLQTAGRAIIIAQGSSTHAATALAGHGACQVNGARILQEGYDETTGAWKTNPDCFTLAPELATRNAREIFPLDGLWMGNKVDSPQQIRRSSLFPKFEANAFITVLQSQPIGADDTPDLLLLNMKAADYVGHKFGPGSKELAATLAAIDTQLARILAALESKVGSNYVLALTADHGMPGEPANGRGRHFGVEIVALLNAKFDPEKKAVIPYYEPENSQIFVDLERLAELKLTLNDLAGFLRAQPFVHSVFTEDEVRRAAAALTR